MKIVIFGCGQIVCRLARVVEESGHRVAGIVTMPCDQLPTGATSVMRREPIIYFDPTQSAEQLWSLKALDAELAVVAGFPRIISDDVLRLFPLGAIGCHPTPLPLGRGRHPVQWMLNMGIRKSAMTFFKLVAQADAGPVVLRLKYKLRLNDTIGTVNARLDGLIERGFRLILAGQLWRHAESQTGPGSCFPARTRADCRIDPRMSAEAIINLVRSFSDPFPGATLIVEGKEVHVVEAHKVYGDQWQPIGKIVQADGKSVVMRVADGYVELTLREDCGQ